MLFWEGGCKRKPEICIKKNNSETQNLIFPYRNKDIKTLFPFIPHYIQSSYQGDAEAQGNVL